MSASTKRLLACSASFPGEVREGNTNPLLAHDRPEVAYPPLAKADTGAPEPSPSGFPLAALETALGNCGFSAGADAALAVYRKARK
jgi:hypothetical protein